METLDILWFNWRDIKNPLAGGAEIYTHEIAKRLVKYGHSVTLFTSQFKNSLEKETIDGVEIIRKGGKYTVYTQAKKFYEKNKNNYDIIIDEINTRPFMTPKYVKKQKIIALIHQLAREYWFYETPFPVNLIGYYILENRWLKNYTNIPTVTVSNSTKQDLQQLRFKKIYIVHNGLNVRPLDKLPEKEEKPTIVFVGRMTKAKKPQDVIEAFKIVKKKIKDAQLWMIGDGYLREKLESKNNNIKFFGYVDRNTKNELVKRAWIITVSGIREGWGQVVTDANALGTPAIGYNIPGLRDSIKHMETGILVPYGDTKEMARTMIMLIKNRELWQKLTRNSLKWAKRFSWDQSAKKFEKIVQTLYKVK